MEPDDGKIQLDPHFKDYIDTPSLFADNERLPGTDGTPGTGLKLSEAVPLCELWWEKTGRFQMPDFGKDPHECLVKSGIMMGLPWFNLDKQEMLRVLAHWYANVGIHTIIQGKSTSQDGEIKNLDKIRSEEKDLLPVLDDAGTHAKTNKQNDDTLETETWKDGYSEIEAEDALLDADGQKIERKETENVEADGKDKGRADSAG